ncbi:alpha/beta hydrolase [Bifidobacterium magnum]|uniref:Carboxylesterase or lipase n=1 Tax=Bifidobacterium magnum TaxID=1692 RepID=A0A087BE31_9BIFI|nr:alpha/beta hydrolase [Bifidobacterium magnum]KFI69281.1 Carboxylesterase or lipase [Bifidobacterium magnum]
MAISKTILAALTHMLPDAQHTYRIQRIMEDVSSKLELDIADRCRVNDIATTLDDGYELGLRVFTPTDAPLRGTILFFHGGGWATGSAQLYSDACAHLADAMHRQVVSVDYRRAPDHKFPRPFLDCYEAAVQLYSGKLLIPNQEGTRLAPADPASITLFGDSAGGNLAAAVALKARDTQDFQVRRQMLLYPCLNNDYDPATTPYDSVRTNGKDYMLTAQDMRDYVNMYKADDADLDNPYFAPLMERDYTHLPRTLVMSAEYCPLRDEDEEYAKRLKEASDDVQCYRVTNGVHGYFLYPRISDLVQTTFALIAHFLDDVPLEPKMADDGKEPAWREVLGTD